MDGRSRASASSSWRARPALGCARRKPRGPATGPPRVELKTLISEDPASGGPLVVPQYLPGIVPSATRPITVAQLLAGGTTGSNAVAFMRETAFTNNAAPVLEGGVKPESALTFELVTNALKKIAHWIPATDEIVEDVPTLRSYIDARLRLGV
jgi:HK97 family phage major capsid protein